MPNLTLTVGKFQPPTSGWAATGRGGEFPTQASVVGRRRDLCECHRSSAGRGEGETTLGCRQDPLAVVAAGGILLLSWLPAGSLLLSQAVGGIPRCRRWDGDDGRRSKSWSWSRSVAAAQRWSTGDLIGLNRTPKRRRFDASSIKTTSF